MNESATCPACGSSQTQTGWGEKLCPGCLLRLALLSSVDGDVAESPTWTSGNEMVTPAPGIAARESGLGVGQVLGARFQVRSFLGKGGMGEVWRAYDLKLRVEVALKALKTDLASDGARLELLRGEVRAAREVTSPNVCRIYDLVELDGTELVSMEYVDGTTLLEVLRKRSPMEPPAAQEMASQFLAGLEAIHEAGLVHRDVKPENIMVTRTGRVVLMDMGIARSPEEGAGIVAGTPAYMAPEQARGEADARSDLFSAGVILAEMVSSDGVRDLESRKSVWTGIRQEPVEVPDSPWSPVVKKAVAKDPDERFQSAHELTRALEEVAFRVHDETGLEPYPGLACFDEGDAQYFFGREAEVEAVWTKLKSAQLLGIIGASGAGKSSFIGAGLLPSRPDGWAISRCTPGNKALDSLREASYSGIEDDPEAVKRLAAGGDQAIVDGFATWRRGHKHALLIVDQFEELFTQNTEEVQARAAELLGRIALDADVGVLLSMRDDFLLRCYDHEQLTPIFSELTPLKPPVGGALRRAVVQPALRCGYRFEDEELADEILAEVEGERGALPLLAFALSRLWEKRDRENGLITRQAYKDIGGVGGALAGHAEELMERLGPERQPIVREIFRNLVTAQGTRAARDADELLSVFRDNRDGAAEVLRVLIDARLLTSYEVPSDDGPGKQRMEVIHESLLRSWPRLVRWQTQDADASQLRDELRQAANQWDEHDRTDDRLWTGAAFKEYEVWRERYPGGLTDVEEAFGGAMTSLATRRRRRRRIAAVSGVSFLLLVLAVVTGLWRQAVLETRRAEASKLLALGQLDFDAVPTRALAWATASIELSDTLEARLLAIKALHRGPPGFLLRAEKITGRQFHEPIFSPTGRWIASRHGSAGEDAVDVWFEDGRPPVTAGEKLGGREGLQNVFFASDDILVTDHSGVHRWWSLDGLDSPIQVEKDRGWGMRTHNKGYYAADTHGGAGRIRWIPFGRGPARTVAEDLVFGPEAHLWNQVDIDASGSVFAHIPEGVKRNGISLHFLDDRQGETSRFLSRRNAVGGLALHPNGDRIAIWDDAGTIEILPIDSDSSEPVRTFQGDERIFNAHFDPTGRWFATAGADSAREVSYAFSIWNLEAPVGASPMVLNSTANTIAKLAFHPRGSWLVGSVMNAGYFFPMPDRYPRVYKLGGRVFDVEFTPDSKWLVSLTCEGPGVTGGQVRLWPLEGQNNGESRVLLEKPWLDFYASNLAFDPTAEHIAVATQKGRVYVLSLTGGPTRELIHDAGGYHRVAFSPNGRLIAAAPYFADPRGGVRIWNLETGETRVVGAVAGLIGALEFVDDQHLMWTGARIHRDSEGGGQVVFNLEDGSVEVVSGQSEFFRIVSPTADFSLSIVSDWDSYDSFRDESGVSEVQWRSLETSETRIIRTHGKRPVALAVDPTGQWIVTGGFKEGVVRIGRVSGEEPHLLYGHTGWLISVAVSPDGRWIATGGNDGDLRLWPMPDLSKPPLHTLPREELIAKLKSLTNVRIVRDDEDPTGWSREFAPFPGWETVPTW